MKFRILPALAALTAVAAAPALAGNPAPAPVEPAPVFVGEPAPAYNWTGGYVGGAIGFAGLNTGVDSDEDFDLGDEFDDVRDDLAGFVDGFDDDGIYGGIRAGYDYAFANGFVLGGQLAYDVVNFDLNFEDDDAGADSDVTFENGIDGILRAGLRAGYGFGPNLIYGTGGYARLTGDDDSDGYFAGLGGERFVTQNITAGAEVLYHQFDGFDVDSLEADITTVGLTVNYRF
ncbi:outer membrane protein [Jannaschia aquimarina]|uniref:Outer membrane protein beta-barrel domain-containing protein n=1 Tax=Jannaschia aquimarina TaxID=935700 RepID=A0A0D1EKJ1_9RHOB|nr:outer membrane beta-barrel protein [Jannaschia aquimarina]KIT16275.1 hypothetical protein jaqu_20290 [Jannaschia aquimarina]SNT14784.1 outer membrane immunogenic protein [Jannaschia aquimarina]